MNIERRKYRRFTIKQFVDLSSDDDVFIQAQGLDLSSGGLSIETKQALDPMTPIFVMIGIPADEEEHVIKLEGYIAHSRWEGGKCFAGVSFTEMEPEDKKVIDTYINNLAKFGA